MDVHLLRIKQLNLKKPQQLFDFSSCCKWKRIKILLPGGIDPATTKLKSPTRYHLVGCLFNMLALQMSILKYFSSVATLKHCKHALANSLLNLNFFKSIQFVISSYCKPRQLDVYPTNFSWRITYYIIKVILFPKYTYTESKDQNLDLYNTK